MQYPIWQAEFGDSRLIASALHHGSALRPEVAALMRLDAAARGNEEDPYTGDWTTIAPTRIVGLRSRFEVDLNRPRELAVYLRPDDCWQLQVWKSPPPEDVVARSLAAYDDFYDYVRWLLERLIARHGSVVILDLHSYNHRRQGCNDLPADPAENPEINLGTESVDRARWRPVVDCCLAELRSFDYFGRQLDVRENVKFRGGHFVRWVNGNFGESACAIAIEVKKFFMDEWTGEVDSEQFDAVGRALEKAAAGVLAMLEE